MARSRLVSINRLKEDENKIELKKKVQRILIKNYLLHMNTASKILGHYFADDFLPKYYFYSNSAEEIAQHIFIITQKLDPENDHLFQISDNGKVITYFVNVGKEFPGKLARIIQENLDMGIAAYDSVKTRSGIRIITIEKKGRRKLPLTGSNLEEIRVIEQAVRDYGTLRSYRHTEAFLISLPENYMYEELNTINRPRRILRHLDIYEKVIGGTGIQVDISDVRNEIDDVNEKIVANEQRIGIGAKNPDRNFIVNILRIVEKHGINLNRSYFDIFEDVSIPDRVCILSLYINREVDLQVLVGPITGIGIESQSVESKSIENLSNVLESILRSISDRHAGLIELTEAIDELKLLIAENTDTSDAREYNNLLLNSISDFMEGARFIGISDNPELLKLMLGFESFSDFFVQSTYGGIKSNKPGFRVKHCSARALAGKGGLRIDPIVEFDEIAALSFLMTWKCARSRILFGGGKGGLMVNPRDFRERKLDFFDTLTNFGCSLFLVTGPFKDVPAGDVGCGPEEIGHMFEGFKTALRELALLSSGVKQGVSIVGNEVLSIDRANHILKMHFGIDPMDDKKIAKLIDSEEYLELVAAAHITGKPKMGIAARTGATGKGLCYSILAAVSARYLHDQWTPGTELTEKEKGILARTCEIDERRILDSNASGKVLISPEDWACLDSVIYRKLLAGKEVIVQGTGKVGGSLIGELARYDVNFIAIADSGGAVLGKNLDAQELLEKTLQQPTRSVIEAGINVERRIEGTAQGAVILELECDILVLAALENAITAQNAPRIKAKLVACGSNGPHTSKAERILNGPDLGITVIYDFLANGGGVIASYFEWLRNLTERFRYESEIILREEFEIDMLDDFIMPEFRKRIKSILLKKESAETTREWNLLLRDIIFTAVNEDYTFSVKHGVSMKTAGYINAELRVLTAVLLGLGDQTRRAFWHALKAETREMLEPFFYHPETESINSSSDAIRAELYGRT